MTQAPDSRGFFTFGLAKAGIFGQPETPSFDGVGTQLHAIAQAARLVEGHYDI
jgi:hypothetical protein